MNHSYAGATVSRRAVVEAGTREGQVWYAVKAGAPSVFGDTKVLGTREVEPSLVLRELVYKKGEPFDARKIAASRQNILTLNLFSEVEFNSGKNPVDRTVVPIEIQVRERPPRNLSLSVGYNTQTQFNARLAWSHYNFLGGGPPAYLKRQLLERHECTRCQIVATAISLDPIEPGFGNQTGTPDLSDLSTQRVTFHSTAYLQFLIHTYGLRRLAPGVS